MTALGTMSLIRVVLVICYVIELLFYVVFIS